MTGKKGMNWNKKISRFPIKINTALTKSSGKKVKDKAKKEKISESAVVRQAVDKFV